MKLADLSDQECLALPCSLRGWEHCLVAGERRDGRSLRCIPKDIERANPLQCPRIRHISETRRHHDPTKRVESEGKALQRGVHLKQDRRQMVLRFGRDSDTRQPGVNFVIVPLDSVHSSVEAIETTTELPEPVASATKVIILTRKERKLIERLEGRWVELDREVRQDVLSIAERHPSLAGPAARSVVTRKTVTPPQSSAMGCSADAPQNGLPVKGLMVPIGGGHVVTFTVGWAR